MQWTGDNTDELREWLTGGEFEPPKHGESAQIWVNANQAWLHIETGDWVAKDRHGFYPIKADVFAETYDPT